MKTILKLAWRNIWRNKKRSIITIVSIFIAVFLALIIRSMQLGMYDNVIKNVAGNYTGYVQVHAKGYWEDRNLDNSIVINDSLTQELLNIKGVQDLVPRLEAFSLASFGTSSKGVLINGVDVEKERKIKPIDERLSVGKAFLPKSNEVIVGKGLAKYFSVKTNDTIYLIGQGYHGISAAGKYKISGIIDLKNINLNNLVVFMPIETMREYLSAPNIVTNIIVVKKNKTDVDKLQSRLKNKLKKDQFEVMTWKKMMPELHQAIVADNVGGIYMVFILYMIITFGIFSTVLMMTEERIFEFGIMTAIGMKKKIIIQTLWLETLFLSLIGVLLGIIAAYPILYHFYKNPFPLPSDKADMMEKFGFLPEIPFSIDSEILITHGLIIFFIGVLVALYPSIKIWRLNPLKAMHKK